MCRQMILLANNDYQQAIFTCEHGTIHMTHQQTTICMPHTEFRQFADFVVNGNLCGLNQSGIGCVREANTEHADMWVGSGGFHLTVSEFFAFSDLLRQALKRLAFLNLGLRSFNGKPPPERYSLN